MTLILKHPIVFFDRETTGINIASDRIVELSYLKVHPNGKEEPKTLLINPTIPSLPKPHKSMASGMKTLPDAHFSRGCSHPGCCL